MRAALRALALGAVWVSGLALADVPPPPPQTSPAPDSAAPSTPESVAPDESDVQDTPLERPTGAQGQLRTLAEIKKSGYIRILTRNNATSFFVYRGHRMGFDYELGKRLAQQLGIRAQFVVPREWGDLIPALLRGEGDVIAGEMTVTPERTRQVLFAAPYSQTRELAVYKHGTPAVKDPADLSGRKVRVRKSSSYFETLQALNATLKAESKPPVEIDVASDELETDDILDQVSKGAATYTLADELIAQQAASYFDDLEVGAPVSGARDLAWAVRPGQTDLASEIDSLFHTEKKGPEFNILKRKYFQDARDAKKRGKETLEGTGSLSPYDPLIQDAAKRYSYDWRLVAAQIYQESRFDPQKKSWCGAQGLFQIMPATAKELGVNNPVDPKEGIEGGAKYMARLMKHFSEVPDPIERYKLALASYNCGPGHVDDARELLRSQGKPTSTWADVQGAMLQLSKEAVHGKTKFGFCRCGEPVDYVRHITERYDAYRQLVPADPGSGVRGK
jgi:membrane-bound lytic murein transglycosylase F